MRAVTFAASLVAVALAAPPVPAEPTVVLVGTHRMKMKDDSVDPIFAGKRKFTWKVRSGLTAPPENQVVMPEAGSAGDPTPGGATGGGGTLTVYNAAGSGEVYTVDLPAENWRVAGDQFKGFRYVYASSAPVWKVWLKSPKITIQGGKAPWEYTLDEASQGTIAVQLTLGTGITWCSTALPDDPAEKWDIQDRFKAASAGPPPATCPAIPTP
jgi:hypothetical protein